MNVNSKIYIPYGRQTITDSDISSVVELLKSPFLTQGSTVPAFERAVAEKVGASYGVAVNSATSALHLACLALGLGPGDTLWTSPTTFVASANCGLYCGADIDFVDIDPSTGLMSITALTHKLRQAALKNSLPKVVVPVHLSGACCDMKEIFSLSQQYGFSVIEDASHAIGGKYYNNFVGDCAYSDVTIFSFHPVKIITTGEGGMAVTNNESLAMAIQALRSHGITKDQSRFVNESFGPWSYEQQALGYNYRMSDIHAALGVSQLERLESNVLERYKLLENYKILLSNAPLTFLKIPSGVYSAVHLGVVRLNNICPQFHLNIFSKLRDAGIGVQLHYSPVHLNPYYQRLGFKKGDYPESELYAQNSFSLPLYPGLSEEQQSYVCKILCTLLTS